MTLAQLKSLCAAYHLKGAADCTVNGIDLFLAAANNARRSAEQLHDFEFARVTATLSIDGVTGGRLSDAVLSGGQYALINTGTVTPNITTSVWYPLGISNGAPTYSLFLSGYGYLTLEFNGSNIWAIFNRAATIDALWQRTSTSIDPTGAYIPDIGGGVGNLILAFTGSFSSLKQVTNVLRTSADGQVLPIDFKSMDSAVEGTRTEIEVSDYYSPNFRYPSDATFLALQQGSLIVQRNRTLFIYPKATTVTDPLSVLLEGYGWLADYTANSLTLATSPDFLVEQAPDYFQWSIICELNYLFKTFVPRSEGNIGAPENLKAEALRKLIIWDSYQIDANSTHSK